MSVQNYYLKFFLRGKENPFIYTVLKQTAKRIEECLLSPDHVTNGGFVEFEHLSKNQNIYIKISQVQMCQLLWDYGVVASNSEEDEGCYSLALVLNGVDEIFYYSEVGSDDLQEIIDTIMGINSYTPSEFFIRVVDDDGEVNLINASDIVLMECLVNNIFDEDLSFEQN
ncbi:hypothetical protein DSM106972_037800 [Dulcicalothrix desertica PCC 7102]|uniref:Uncharacterized protein n=1 Tax=Dulcicalothrix desertica PCC 7102 TaxID=232991 RepID=A0A433VFV1_9CYAN|nr:hypothetical protein [Dulcicalothrix desertica]RUT04959.1 hypothetical protein DSM106972_037800 [Dulcicalothrix desertica PCC 7102]TWH43818.1 hypothetical protein CAL7102_07562 [Dulcicalothrix desertica PCC 7102]